MPLVFAPGEAFQFDWSEDWAVLGGERTKLQLGMFNRIFAELAGKAGQPDRVMTDATHLKAQRTAASLLKGGLFPDVSGAPKAG